MKPSLANLSCSVRAMSTLKPLLVRKLCYTAPLLADPGSSPPGTSARPERPSNRVLVNEEIARSSRQVRLVDPKTGSLAGPFSVKDILSRMDKTKFRLQQVVAATPAEASKDAPISEQTQYPICKLIDKKEEYDKQRAQMREAKAAKSDEGTPTIAPGTVSKEVQISWAVSPNDLSHKLSKAKKELVRGAKINVVISQKTGTKRFIKGQNKAEEERRDKMLASVQEFLCKNDEGGEEAPPIAKRLGEIDWQKGGSAAVISFERIRK